MSSQVHWMHVVRFLGGEWWWQPLKIHSHHNVDPLRLRGRVHWAAGFLESSNRHQKNASLRLWTQLNLDACQFMPRLANVVILQGGSRTVRTTCRVGSSKCTQTRLPSVSSRLLSGRTCKRILRCELYTIRGVNPITHFDRAQITSWNGLTRWRTLTINSGPNTKTTNQVTIMHKPI